MGRSQCVSQRWNSIEWIRRQLQFGDDPAGVLLLLFVGFGQVDALRVWSDPLASLAHPGARDYGVGAMGKADTVMGRTGLSRRAKINNLHENPTKEFFLNNDIPTVLRFWPDNRTGESTCRTRHATAIFQVDAASTSVLVSP